MAEFRLASSYDGKILRGAWTAGILIPLLTFVLMYAAGFLKENPLTAVATVLGIVAIGLVVAVRRQRRQARSFLLTIDERGIRRTQDGFDVVEIHPSEVRRITVAANGTLTVIDRNDRSVLLIPADLEGYDRCRELLASLGIAIVPHRRGERWQAFGLVAVLVVSTVALFAARQTAVVLAAGAALLGVLAVAIHRVRTGAVLDRRTRRRFGWQLVVVAAIVLVRMAMEFVPD